MSQYVPTAGSLVLISTKSRAELVSSTSSSPFTSSFLLTSTSAVLAANKVTLYHVESLAMLRALLSSLQHCNISFLGIDSFVSLQEEGSDLSAQGISRTLAAMVNVSSCSKGILVLRESPPGVERVVPMLRAGRSDSLGHSSINVLQILGRWMNGFWYQEENTGEECSATWICRGEKSHIQWKSLGDEIEDVQISRL